MIKYDDWFIPLQSGLSTYLATTVIQAEQSHEQPPYPFVSIKQTIPAAPIAPPHVVTLTDSKEQVIQDFELTLSITVHAKGLENAADIAQQAQMYFAGKGYNELARQHITVVEALASTNRDVFITIDYERRVGFDLILRYRAIDSYDIDTIETVIVGGE